MKLNLPFKKSNLYFLTAGLLTGLFVILIMTIISLLSSYGYITSFRISILAAVLISLLFNPFRKRVQARIDNMFYKGSYDYYATVRKVSHELALLFDRKDIYEFVGKTILSTLELDNIHLLAAVQGGGYELVYSAWKKSRHNISYDKHKNVVDKVKIKRRSGLAKFYRESDDIILKDKLHAVNKGTIDEINRELEAFHGEVSVPVFVDHKLKLLIILGGKLSGETFTNEDIDLLKTLSHQTSIALKNAGLYLEKINAERLASIGMMAATFAHEIRNPLTSLKTFAQLMPEKYNDPEFRETFSRIVVGEIEKIDGLIGDLLDFSAGKKSARMNDLNLTELVDTIVEDIKGKLGFENANINIEKGYNGDAINMSGDAGKLKQAFGNIILNGCQAMHGEGVLRVDIKPAGKHADVVIEDTGEGILPEDLPRIFDPFVTTKEKGIGLGLAISKKIIENHNGKIYIRSQPAKGTTFTVSLPVQNG